MKYDDWSQIDYMNEERFYAASTVFEGKIVVTGGKSDTSYSRLRTREMKLSSVEAYDYYENKWTYLPDMNRGRYNHTSVSMANKMFVIGEFERSSFEMFDSYSRKFHCLTE